MKKFATAFITAFVSGYAVDTDEQDLVLLRFIGPRGGERPWEYLTEVQAGTLRDELDLALTRFADKRARTS